MNREEVSIFDSERCTDSVWIFGRNFRSIEIVNDFNVVGDLENFLGVFFETFLYSGYSAGTLDGVFYDRHYALVSAEERNICTVECGNNMGKGNTLFTCDVFCK